MIGKLEMKVVWWGEDAGNTMARMMQALQNHPQVLQKLRQEQEEVVAKFGDTFTPDVLDAMPYAEAVMKETMRVWPTVPQGPPSCRTNLFSERSCS
jgi:cytochrome P450